MVIEYNPTKNNLFSSHFIGASAEGGLYISQAKSKQAEGWLSKLIHWWRVPEERLEWIRTVFTARIEQYKKKSLTVDQWRTLQDNAISLNNLIVKHNNSCRLPWIRRFFHIAEVDPSMMELFKAKLSPSTPPQPPQTESQPSLPPLDAQLEESISSMEQEVDQANENDANDILNILEKAGSFLEQVHKQQKREIDQRLEKLHTALNAKVKAFIVFNFEKNNLLDKATIQKLHSLIQDPSLQLELQIKMVWELPLYNAPNHIIESIFANFQQGRFEFPTEEEVNRFYPLAELKKFIESLPDNKAKKDLEELCIDYQAWIQTCTQSFETFKEMWILHREICAGNLQFKQETYECIEKGTIEAWGSRIFPVTALYNIQTAMFNCARKLLVEKYAPEVNACVKELHQPHDSALLETRVRPLIKKIEECLPYGQSELNWKCPEESNDVKQIQQLLETLTEYQKTLQEMIQEIQQPPERPPETLPSCPSMLEHSYQLAWNQYGNVYHDTLLQLFQSRQRTLIPLLKNEYDAINWAAPTLDTLSKLMGLLKQVETLIETNYRCIDATQQDVVNTVNDKLCALKEEFTSLESFYHTTPALLKKLVNREQDVQPLVSLKFFRTDPKKGVYAISKKLSEHSLVPEPVRQDIKRLLNQLFPSEVYDNAPLMERCATYWSKGIEQLNKEELESIQKLVPLNSLPAVLKKQLELILQAHQLQFHPKSKTRYEKIPYLDCFKSNYKGDEYFDRILLQSQEQYYDKNFQEAPEISKLVQAWMSCSLQLRPKGNPLPMLHAKIVKRLRRVVRGNADFVLQSRDSVYRHSKKLAESYNEKYWSEMPKINSMVQRLQKIVEELEESLTHPKEDTYAHQVSLFIERLAEALGMLEVLYQSTAHYAAGCLYNEPFKNFSNHLALLQLLKFEPQAFSKVCFDGDVNSVGFKEMILYSLANALSNIYNFKRMFGFSFECSSKEVFNHAPYLSAMRALVKEANRG